MELFLFVLKFIIGPVTAVVITLLVREPLKTSLAPLISRFGSKKQEGIIGKWEATFYYGPDEIPYIEGIQISMLFGHYVGHIIPYSKNHEALKKIENSKTLRLRGEIKDNRFFTGIWFHPNRRNHHQGAYEMIIKTNHKEINGIWLGYSERENFIESGRWE